MFDEKKSKAFQVLKKICPDLKSDEQHMRSGEIGCSGTCEEVDCKRVSFYSKSEHESFEATLELAVQIFEDLNTYIEKAKEKICEVCLPLYLEDKDDDEPVLTKEEYKEKLDLAEVSTFYENTVILDFCDGSTPYGHLLSATSLDKGKIFTDVEAVG